MCIFLIDAKLWYQGWYETSCKMSKMWQIAKSCCCLVNNCLQTKTNAMTNPQPIVGRQRRIVLEIIVLCATQDCPAENDWTIKSELNERPYLWGFWLVWPFKYKGGSLHIHFESENIGRVYFSGQKYWP